MRKPFYFSQLNDELLLILAIILALTTIIIKCG
ncbi:MAG: hypothetical protein ACI9N3_002793, partial [Colwellia sp.]